MKLSTKSRYGTRILIELAKHEKKGPLQVSKISEYQKIPHKYLEQLIRVLRMAGFVKSIRGPKGGHEIAMDPALINLGQIVRLFEDQTDLVECISLPEKCDMSGDCLVRSAWQEATSALYDKLNTISIADLLQVKNCNKPGLPC
jgi:Rrf2 family iron-sulfur cluster assembly transcriptional regulator